MAIGKSRHRFCGIVVVTGKTASARARSPPCGLSAWCGCLAPTALVPPRSPPCGLSAWSGCLAPTALVPRARPHAACPHGADVWPLPPSSRACSPPCGLSAWSGCLAPTALVPRALAPMRLVRMERMSGPYRPRPARARPHAACPHGADVWPLPPSSRARSPPCGLSAWSGCLAPTALVPRALAPMRLVRMERMSGPYRPRPARARPHAACPHGADVWPLPPSSRARSPPCGLSAWSGCLAPTALVPRARPHAACPHGADVWPLPPSSRARSPPCGLSAWSGCLAPTALVPRALAPMRLVRMERMSGPYRPRPARARPHAACPHGADVWPLPPSSRARSPPCGLSAWSGCLAPTALVPRALAPMRLVRMERMSGPYRPRPAPLAPMRLVRMERMSGPYRPRPARLAPMRLVRMERMSGPYRPRPPRSPPCGLSAWSGCLAPTALVPRARPHAACPHGADVWPLPPSSRARSPPCGLSAWSGCLAPTALVPRALAPMRLVRMERMSGPYRPRPARARPHAACPHGADVWPLPPSSRARSPPCGLSAWCGCLAPTALVPRALAPMRLVRMERMSGPYRPRPARARPHAACPHGADVWPLPPSSRARSPPCGLSAWCGCLAPTALVPRALAPMRLVRMERMSGPYRPRPARARPHAACPHGADVWPLPPSSRARSPPCGLSAWSGCLAPTEQTITQAAALLARQLPSHTPRRCQGTRCSSTSASSRKGEPNC